jgi:hypothetical protein
MLGRPIPMAVPTKVWVWGRSLAGIAGSNAAGVVDVCLLWVLCVVRLKFLRRPYHSSRGVLPSVVCLRRELHEASLHATRQRIRSPASEQVASKGAMPITRKNEKAGQSASIASFHHSTSQRDDPKNCNVLLHGPCCLYQLHWSSLQAG